jgi:hypothetical protein
VVTMRVRSRGRCGTGRSWTGRMARVVAVATLLMANFFVASVGVAATTTTRSGAEPRQYSSAENKGPGSDGSAGRKGPATSDGPHGSKEPVHSELPPPAPDVATGPDSLQLLSQTPWVDPSSTLFDLHLKITARNPGSEMLAVNVYTALTTRSQFQGALGGEFYGSYYQPGGGPVPLTDLARDPTGGVDVDIPVNQANGVLSATGVYPVQVFLEKGGVPMGKALTTFIVYAGKDLSSLHLGASFVLPMVGKVQIGPLGAPGPLSDSAAATLQGDAADLARWKVPVTIRAADPTVQALANGTAADRSALVDLRRAIASGDELLPATALPLNIQQLVGSGLTNDLETQLSLGDADLGRLLGAQPSLSTWASAGDIDPATMSALASLGVTEVAVPEDDLSALPLTDQEFTFAQPTKLSVQGPDILALGADTELSARVGLAASPGTAVLVANQFLAELAMIDLERPSDQRGVVVIPSPGIEVSPVFLSVLLAGLQGNPLVQALTLQQLFKDVPLAPSDSGGLMVRQLNETSHPGAQLAGVGQLQQALADVAADGEVYGPDVPLVKGLGQRLFVSLSSTFDGSQRASIISRVLRAADSALGNVRLPPSISITLTSRQGRLPLTLVSAATSPVRVRLVLISEQLSFLAATFSEGSCVPGNAEKSAENCLLTLSRPTTVLRIPVVVRAPGAFPLSLQIETPSGDMVLRTGTGSVTSTAISDVGWFLMVGAALFLAVWWVRNARHGRRARRLVPRPDDDAGGAEAGPVTAGGAEAGLVTAGPPDPGAVTADPGARATSAATPGSNPPGAVNPGERNPGPPTSPGVADPLGADPSGADSGASPGGVPSGASPSGASPSGAGAASPVGASPSFAVRSGRDGYPAKHVLRPPR